MDLNGPIALGRPTGIRAISFVEDVRLGTISTPRGRVVFLQVVGLTADECEAQRVEEGSRRDGSSQYVAFVAHVEVEVGSGARVSLGARAVLSLLRLLPGRLPYGKPLTLASRTHAVRFEPGAFPSWHPEEDGLVITLPPGSCESLCRALEGKRGTYRWDPLPGLELVVLPSEIKDAEGKVVRVIG